LLCDDLSPQPAHAPLTRQIHRALLDLYDPPHLARSPLLAHLNLAGQPDPPAALRRILLRAIDDLKPADSISPQSNAWRTYRILLYRYVQQIPQSEIAASLGFSVRQLQRHEQVALQILADHLTAHYNLTARQGDSSDTSASSDDELARLRAAFMRETVSLAEAVQTALKTARPLLDAAQIRIETQIASDLPPVASQIIPLRQALVSVFTAIARHAPASLLTLRVATESDQAHVVAQAILTHAALPNALRDEALDNLVMARRLIALSGGQLHWNEPASDNLPFTVVLSLPLSHSLTVLAIDDNRDSLHLLQRMLDGARYHLVAESDPARAVETAREVAPRAIVLDVMLPGMDGWELLGRLREHPDTRTIPIIVSTILPHQELAMTLGAAAFLRKPVSQAALLATLDALTGARG